MLDNQTIKSGLEVITSAVGAVKALAGFAGSSKNTDVKQHIDDAVAKLGDVRERYIELQEKYLAAIDAVLPDCVKEWGPSETIDLRAFISDLNNAFVEWRYLYEKGRTNLVRIEPLIFVMKVLHEACKTAMGLASPEGVAST